MPQPLPKFHPIVDVLNTIRNNGQMRDPSDISMLRLKRDIESLSSSDPKYHRLTFSAFYGVTGNWEKMRHHGEAAVRSYKDDETKIFYVTTLLNTGFISEAASVLDDVDWNSPEFPERKLTLSALTFQYPHLINYTELCARAKLDGYKKLDMVNAAQKILDQHKISNSVVAEMMDLTGEILREHNLLRVLEYIVIPYLADQTITILQPVNLPADKIAELDWEYALRLFERMPNAPTTIVHIGFTSSPQ